MILIRRKSYNITVFTLDETLQQANRLSDTLDPENIEPDQGPNYLQRL